MKTKNENVRLNLKLVPDHLEEGYIQQPNHESSDY